MITKVMISLPKEFLAEGDCVARRELRSHSELLREALRLYMRLSQNRVPPGADPLVQQALATQNRLALVAPGTGEDSTSDVRRWRETRG